MDQAQGEPLSPWTVAAGAQAHVCVALTFCRACAIHPWVSIKYLQAPQEAIGCARLPSSAEAPAGVCVLRGRVATSTVSLGSVLLSFFGRRRASNWPFETVEG